MQNLRPETLSDNEILRYALLENPKGLSESWGNVLLQRMAVLVDQNHTLLSAQNKIYEEAFEEGFAAGVAVANQ
jgi:hypothetical protein